MEAAVVVGVAAASLQFLEQGFKFVAIAKRLHRSVTESSPELAEIRVVDENLQDISKHLAAETAKLTRSDANKELTVLVGKCLEVSKDIAILAEKCTPRKPGFRGILSAAARTMFEQEKINNLQGRLSELRSQLNTQLLMSTRQATVSSRFSDDLGLTVGQ